jgi:hypothetical protein
MPTYQRAGAVVAAIKRETTTGVAATAAGATQVRIVDSPGLELKRATVQSQERRADGLMSMPRLGYKTVDGGFNCEISVGGATDILLEAMARSTWVATWSAPFSSLTTVAIGTNTLTAAGGSWATLTGGSIKVGDIFYLSSTTVTGNNGTNKMVTAVATLTLSTEAGAFTTLAATATGTISILKRVSTGATPVRYSHTVEQYDQDSDLSELFLGCRLLGLSMAFAPGQMATMNPTLVGMDRTLLTTGTSPWFTSPTLTTSLGLLADDSAIRYNGAAVATFTQFSLNFQIDGAGEPTIGSLVTGDIFDNDLNLTGTVTGLVSDFSDPILFDAETEFEMAIKLQEPTGSATPPACLALFFPRVKIIGRSAPFGGGTGAKKQTLTLAFAPKVSTFGYNASLFQVASSGA